MVIKASRIHNLTDARYFAARDVQFLGFNLEEGTDGFLDPIYMKAIREWVEGPVIVGEFSRSPAGVVREAAQFYGLEAVQVPAETAAADLKGLTVIRELPAGLEPDALERILTEQAAYTAWFLLPFTAADLERSAAEAWRELLARHPILLHPELPTSAWPRLLTDLRPSGLSLAGGAEEQVGVKSFDELEEIFGFLEGY